MWSTSAGTRSSRVHLSRLRKLVSASTIEVNNCSWGDIALTVSAIAEQLNEERAVAGDVTGVGMVAAMRAALALDDTR